MISYRVSESLTKLLSTTGHVHSDSKSSFSSLFKIFMQCIGIFDAIWPCIACISKEYNKFNCNLKQNIEKRTLQNQPKDSLLTAFEWLSIKR